MKSIVNYAKDETRSFKEFPFNDCDSLVLSTIVYFDFEDSIPSLFSRKKIKLKDIVIKNSYVKFLGDKKKYLKLLEGAISNPRFNELYLDNYYEKESEKEEVQFKAMTFENDDFVYVSYMGTKSCLVSWKEDFMLSYLKQVPAQKLALKFLNRIMIETLKPIIVGGHSKGGNLAIYASMKTMWLNRIRIKKVYSHDGPGFSKIICHSSKYNSIKRKISKTVPATSIVGMLFNSIEEYKIIKASGRGFNQHSPLNWLVKDSEFIYLKTRSRTSKIIDKRVSNWIDNLSKEDKIKFTECLFEALDKGGFDAMFISNRNYLSMIRAVRKGLKNVDEETKDIIIEIVKRLFVYKKEISKNSDI
ncbi:MAG: DUF2974 domain-containing protein [Bacilli bacterium]|nr:DUF2974 domain-containing protein [Bacilli bacterium]